MRAPKKPARKKGIADLPPRKVRDAEGKAVRGGRTSDVPITKLQDKTSPK
jgi:hypothetical protein